MSFAPCPSPFNMAAHVLAAGAATPDKVALRVLGGEELTYAELIAAVRGTATGLLNAGLQPGDRVLLRLGNTPDFPIAYLGAIAAGLVPVPTSTQLTAPEITAMAAALTPAATLTATGVALPAATGLVISQEELHGFRTLQPADFAMGDPERPAYIVFTSGTSGNPRGVIHAHRAVWARKMMWHGWEGLTADDRLLHAGAFNWTYTLGTGLMDPWAVGATALIPAPGLAPADLGVLLAREEVTIFAAAPGVYRQMLRHPLPPTPRLRHGLSAGEKLPEALRIAWEEATGTTLHEAFGMSECSTFISGSPAYPAPAGTLGFPQPGRRVMLRDGEICVHKSDPGLMLGYLNAPGETAARFDGDWFRTGDQGHENPDGSLSYAGRADDMMNAGGYRVSPIEVENVMSHFSGLTDCAAIEVPVKADTTVIALIYCAPAEVDPAALAEYAAERLARYKCPRIFRRADSLPRSANNKLLRSRLRQDWTAPDGET